MFRFKKNCELSKKMTIKKLNKFKSQKIKKYVVMQQQLKVLQF